MSKNVPTTEWCPVQCLNDLDCSEQPKRRCCPSKCGGWKCIYVKQSSSPRPPVQVQPLKNNLHIKKLAEQKNENEEEKIKIEEQIEGSVNSILLRPVVANPLVKCEPVK